MAKINGNYEVAYILKPELGEEATAALVAKFKAMAEARGTVAEVDEWGTRKLAYPINDETEGVYTVIHFTSGPDFPAELDRVYKITDGVLRTMIVAQPEEAETEAK